MTAVLREFLDADGRRTPFGLVDQFIGRNWNYYDDRSSTGRIEIVALGKTVARIYLTNGCEAEDLANAQFIAAASKIAPALRALLEEVEGLRVEVQRLKAPSLRAAT